MALKESEMTVLKERLVLRPLTILRFHEPAGPASASKPEVEDADLKTVFDISSLVVDVLMNAKCNRELWPPAALADSELAAVGSVGAVTFSAAAINEMRALFLSRILRLDWLAVTVALTGVVAMNGLCRLSPDQIRTLEADYRVRLLPSCYLFETGYTVPEKRRLRLSIIMKIALIEQISLDRGISDVDVLTVILDSQKANITLNRSLGFTLLASLTISQGAERGRQLHLYSRRLAPLENNER